jgi:hypothetical protein
MYSKAHYVLCVCVKELNKIEGVVGCKMSGLYNKSNLFK